MYKATKSFILLLILCITFINNNHMVATPTASDNSDNQNNDTILPYNQSSTDSIIDNQNTQANNNDPAWYTLYFEQVKALIQQVTRQLNNVD